MGTKVYNPILEISVGDHRPVGRDRIRSRPKNLKTGRDPENFSGRDLVIFQKIYQDIQLDESNLKFSIGLRPTFGSRPKKFQPGRLTPVATVFGSRSDIFYGSRPIFGRDPERNLGRDLDRVEVPNTIRNAFSL
jgi:hypothetical protein